MPCLAALTGSSKIVYYTFDYYDPVVYPWHTWMEKRTARIARLQVNGEFHRGYITRAQYKLSSPLLVVPPSLPASWPTISFNRTLPNNAGGEEPFTLALHGPYSRLRMVDELFEALAILPARFRLLMGAQAGSDSYVEERLRTLAIRSRVEFLGTTDFSRILERTSVCDAGLLLYRNNDLGNFFQGPGRLCEYLVNGLPVLASSHTGLEQLVNRYRIGECVDSRRPERVAEGVLKLEASIRSGHLTREHCRHVFLSCMATDNRVKSVLTAFESLLDPESSGRLDGVPEPWWLDCDPVSLDA